MCVCACVCLCECLTADVVACDALDTGMDSGWLAPGTEGMVRFLIGTLPRQPVVDWSGASVAPEYNWADHFKVCASLWGGCVWVCSHAWGSVFTWNLRSPPAYPLNPLVAGAQWMRALAVWRLCNVPGAYPYPTIPTHCRSQVW